MEKTGKSSCFNMFYSCCRLLDYLQMGHLRRSYVMFDYQRLFNGDLGKAVRFFVIVSYSLRKKSPINLESLPRFFQRGTTAFPRVSHGARDTAPPDLGDDDDQGQSRCRVRHVRSRFDGDGKLWQKKNIR